MFEKEGQTANETRGKRRTQNGYSNFSIQWDAEMGCRSAHASDGVDFLLKFLFLFILLKADRGNAIGLEDEDEKVFEGEEIGEKRSHVIDNDGNHPNGKERPVLQG